MKHESIDFINPIKPLFVAVIAYLTSLTTHEILSNCAVLLSIAYTAYKFYKEIKNKKG